MAYLSFADGSLQSQSCRREALPALPPTIPTHLPAGYRKGEVDSTKVKRWQPLLLTFTIL